ncbi:MAG: hypothetical protein B1H08_00025 [Candidatus Omnitrophica bacterium 4484_171]|nr:MAG: hypothetical protein B1H08_00025 [Candidatus Omnitrophica bacterium 4484_171]
MRVKSHKVTKSQGHPVSPSGSGAGKATRSPRESFGQRGRQGYKLITIFLLLFAFCLVYTAGFAQEAGVIETLKFKDADIRVVLQAITQKAIKDGKHVNIILGADIKGLVTVDLENVDWETALKAVLKTYDYGYEWIGNNIILVDTLDNLASKRKKTEEARVAEPLDTKVFVLNFAKVADVQGAIRRALTPRGRLTFDARTNTIVITDAQSNLVALEKIVKALDTITPQVLIEAKIIETDLGVTDKLGINWNIQASAAGSKRPMTWPTTGHSDNKYLKSSTLDFPTPGSTLFTFGTLDASSLSATLDAILTDTHTKILSMPKITTMDNNTATIDVITEDPVPDYTYNSDTGAWEINGYDWKKYGVTLEVTPQINKEGFVTLTVKPKVSEKVDDKIFTSSGGTTATVPILNTQTTSTKVMIKDGETLVIAGLIRDKVINVTNKVPLLGDIPVLGYLFRHKNKTTEKKNLMIFITPRIVTPKLESAEK